MSVFDLSSRKAFARSVHEAFELGDDRFVIFYEHQEAPNTFVDVRFRHNGNYRLSGVGYSKVSYPDTFSPDGGRRIAIDKALYQLIGKMFDEVGPLNNELPF